MSFKSLAWMSLALFFVGLLSGCGGSEERKAEYLERGRKYFEEKNYDKAKVEFKNVLQIDPKTAKPYFYLGQIEESKQKWQEAFGLYLKAVELNGGDIEAKVKLAKFYLLGKETQKVAELLDAVLKAAPDHLEGRMMRAALANLKGDAAAAIGEMTRITDQHPARTDAFLVLAMLYEQQKNPDEAEKILQRGLAENPGNAVLQVSLAKLSLQLNKADKAEELLKQLIAAQPEQLEHRNALAGFYIQQKRLDDAEKVYHEAVQADPKDGKRSLLLAEFLARRGNADGAIAELNKAVADNPKDAAPRFGLANLYEQLKDTEKAQRIFKDIIELDERAPDALKAKNRLALLALSQGHEGEAIKRVDEILVENPQDNLALMLRGRIALARKDAQQAIASFRSVLKDQPESAEVFNLLAAAHLLDGKPALAQESLEKAVAVNPADFALRKNLVEFLVRQKNHQAALDKTDDYLKLNPKSLEGLNLKADVLALSDRHDELEALLRQIKADFPDNGLAPFRLGSVYLGRKNYDAALAEYEEAVRKSPNDYEPLKAITTAYLEAQQPGKALARIQKALSENPKHPTAYQLLAIYHLTQKQENEAVKALNKAIDNNPRWLLPYANLGTYYEQKGQRELAVETYRRGLNTLPGEVNLLMNLARVYEAAKDYSNSLKQYEAILKDHPDNLLAVNNIASLLSLDAANKADLTRALVLAKRLEDSEEPAFLDTLAWIHYQLGDFEKALPLQTKAVEKSPETPIFQYHLGMIRFRRGDGALAREHLRKAIDSGKDFIGLDEARKVHEKLGA
ncbi:MAG TPA: tetratricopeptide repeat protein [Methylococcaceae bacterium]|nr:tetratricopeptide repeat protein [Methylococcaceae bacterium]